MTIHKAKGLEARIVIIYSWALLLEESLGARNGFRGRTLDLTKADGSRLTALSLQWGPVRIVTDSHLEAVDLEARYCSEEAMRLTYVAVTRACDQLVLLQWPSKQLEVDHFNGIWPDSGGQAATFELSKWTPQESVKKALEPSQLTLDVESHKLLWDKRREALEAMQPILRHPTDLEFHHEPAEIEGGSTPSSLATGSLVHAYLEKRLRGSFDKPFLEDLWKEFVTEHTDSYSIQQATDILTDFYAGDVTDNSGLPLCKRVERSNILGQEIPVFLTIGQQAWHGVIDLIMEDEGVIYAIDFKTGPLSHPFPDVYAQQEMVYGEAIRRLFPSQEVRFEFWWLGTGDR
jgi:ATP-dependent exoDNAse (exonuclease V) beta subunit